MARRQFGNIRRLPSGRYQASYWYDGKHHIADATFGTKADANAWVSNEQAKIFRSEWLEPELARMPFSYWAELWTTTLGRIKPRTRLGYLSKLDIHVMPVFEDRPLFGITTVEVEQFLSSLATSGCAPGTVNGARQVLRHVFSTAVKSGAIRHNPCDGVRLARPAKSEMRFLNAEEIEVLANAIAHPTVKAAGHGAGPHWATELPEYGLLVRFAAYSGLRAGEIAALRRKRVDLKRSSVEVAESVAEVTGLGLDQNL